MDEGLSSCLHLPHPPFCLLFTLPEVSLACQKSFRCYGAEQSSRVCAYTQGLLLHMRIQTKAMKSVARQLVPATHSTPESLEFCPFQKVAQLRQVLLCFSNPTSTPHFLLSLLPSPPMTVLVIHASLATSHCSCGRNRRFHL